MRYHCSELFKPVWLPHVAGMSRTSFVAVQIGRKSIAELITGRIGNGHYVSRSVPSLSVHRFS
jgi:hypothetical protein